MMCCCREIYIVFFLCLIRSLFADFIVNTSSGPVQGVPSHIEDVEAFLGIPYAEPPIGDLRFRKTVPKKQWTDVHNASSLPPPCPQFKMDFYYFMPDVTNMSEDCLYLNVWTPKSMSSDNLRPVIIFIHPGGFLSGSSNIYTYDGSNFASRGDVIIVTINYRLGALGFLVTYSEDAEGNMGMYDQVTAIKWMKENAKAFGGDPENIILMGASAGSFSISAHIVSPLSKNLFKKAIMHSGSLTHPLTMGDNTRLYRNSETVASLVGCANESMTLKSDSDSIVECLKNIPINKIIEAETKILRETILVFYPRIKDDFLPKSPVDLMREGDFNTDIDVMIGLAKDEGTVFLIVAMQDYFGRFGKNVGPLSKSRASAIGRAILHNMEESQKIAKHYLDSVKNRTTIGYANMLANILGDYVISCGTLFFADFLSVNGSSVYFFKFGYRAASTPMAEWMGIAHLDELQYVFGNPYHDNFTAEESELSDRMIDRWASFAKTGNPNILGQMRWLQYSYHDPLYLNFGQEEETIRWKPVRRCEWWRKRFNAEIEDE